MNSVVLDAHALLVWLQGEPGNQKVKRLIEDSRAGRIAACVSLVNLGEVYYKLIQRAGGERAKDFLAFFKHAGVEIVVPDEETTFLAAELKAGTGIPYPDAFAAATASRRGARLVTGDRHFEKLPADIGVDWI